MNKREIVNLFRTARGDLDFNQLERLTGIPKRTLINVEEGSTVPSQRTIEKIKNLLKRQTSLDSIGISSEPVECRVKMEIARPPAKLPPVFTEKGLNKIAEIVREARGHMSYMSFHQKTGISHATLHNMEAFADPDRDNRYPNHYTPTLNVLEAIAQHSPYTLYQLIAIGREEAITSQPEKELTVEYLEGLTQGLTGEAQARLCNKIISKSVMDVEQIFQLKEILDIKLKQLCQKLEKKNRE